MAQEIKINKIQEFTRFPLEIVTVADKILPNIMMKTPMGDREVGLKRTFYPFLFGSATQIDKDSSEVINEIQRIEKESIEWLIKNWLSNAGRSQ